ncbi:uncharacterized protein LOC132295127 [Cornus florida]|uniref:uncharacterized protein LOC132295127 n=1 Tax=Cornus florida TaxID=4283 RepID=UPI0028A19283|nr:uncharacterized protein LOC132295127 [Cornus florida]XP_059649237.1 uncharacterized protein LOC132295127 [Cornus florida]XP_059649243.1 uncharacterized protein LOC132295127 [Cornus florida]XP_059649251.1 uncharacterized protein LOC132295127 [Cornus florida]XP_059649259.1 uncharacterized protein LOC132295127 [Cornus florida]XP_059649268.1 uncharacterized protein LOC132295127 [Cornus florida]
MHAEVNPQILNNNSGRINNKLTMKRTVSEMEKVSEENTEASTSKSSQPPAKKRRGPTRCKNVVNATTLIPLRVNKYGQPIGPGSGTYTNYLGTLARSARLAPLCYKTWWEMSKRFKEDMWNIVKGKYDVGIISKQWTLSAIGTKWIGYKCELKSEYYSVRDTDAERLANPPPDVEKEHWEFLVRHWAYGKGG